MTEFEAIGNARFSAEDRASRGSSHQFLGEQHEEEIVDRVRHDVGASWAAATTAQAQNRYYFQGPFGPGGTYNLYELKGIGDLTVNPGQYFGRYVVENACRR